MLMFQKKRRTLTAHSSKQSCMWIKPDPSTQGRNKEACHSLGAVDRGNTPIRNQSHRLVPRADEKPGFT
jgi:hypothetical protein